MVSKMLGLFYQIKTITFIIYEISAFNSWNDVNNLMSIHITRIVEKFTLIIRDYQGASHKIYLRIVMKTMKSIYVYHEKKQ